MGDKIKYFQIGDEFEELIETAHYESDDDELERTQVFIKHDTTYNFHI
jgi:hypothetical protein